MAQILFSYQLNLDEVKQIFFVFSQIARMTQILFSYQLNLDEVKQICGIGVICGRIKISAKSAGSAWEMNLKAAQVY